MRFDIITLFPDFFQGPFEHGVLQRAVREHRVEIALHALRDYTHDAHRTVDDRPFGGGEGMVLKPGPLFECVEALGVAPKAQRDPAREMVLLLSAGGPRFTQPEARRLAGLQRLVLICGRYEGVDERVAALLCDGELSIGDFVLSGGELGAAVVVDAVARLLPGVLGHADSSRFESFGLGDRVVASSVGGVPRTTYGAGGILDYPQYTRPATFRGSSVPEALLSGDHRVIRTWRRTAALARTLTNRPDLLAAAELSGEDQTLLEEMGFQSSQRSDEG